MRRLVPGAAGADDDCHRHSRLLNDLCGTLFSIIDPSSSSAARSRRTLPQRVTPAGLVSMLLGASLALMLCGSLTFFVGFLLMPWVVGLVVVLYVAGIVSTLSGLGRSVLCPASSSSTSSSSAKDDMSGSLFSKLSLIQMDSDNCQWKNS